MREKSGGSKPGIPPSAHTSGWPSPNGREASIWRSGRVVGSLEFDSNTAVPTAKPSAPGSASTTIWKPEAPVRWNVATPSERISTGGLVVPSAPTKPKKVISGPLRGVGVANGSPKAASTATISAAVTLPSPLTSSPGHSALPGDPASPNRRGTRTIRSASSTCPSQLTSAGKSAHDRGVGSSHNTDTTARPTKRLHTRAIPLSPSPAEKPGHYARHPINGQYCQVIRRRARAGLASGIR